MGQAKSSKLDDERYAIGAQRRLSGCISLSASSTCTYGRIQGKPCKTHRVGVVYTKRVAEARYLQRGEPGNCTDSAYTKMVELEKMDISSTIMACRLRSDDDHAYLMTPEGRLGTEIASYI